MARKTRQQQGGDGDAAHPSTGAGDEVGVVEAQGGDGGAADQRLHLKAGWWSLLIFLMLGGVLEAMHGFKVGWYLDVDSEIRRTMWTLAHAHGALLALVHVVFAVTIRATPGWASPRRRLASRCLIAAGVLVPAGFFLGGIFTYGGDPGLGVFLAPVGALALFVAVFLTARGVSA